MEELIVLAIKGFLVFIPIHFAYWFGKRKGYQQSMLESKMFGQS